ncbi:MAG UNVERIFIED_CONTAM: type II toxin-antitoxin system PrlF family antitoxin [Microcystis novacekii LVE1205-3]
MPDSVRKGLGLNKRDKICYNIQPDGKVWISRADGAEENNPVLGKFLNFLAQDSEQTLNTYRQLVLTSVRIHCSNLWSSCAQIWVLMHHFWMRTNKVVL